MYKTELIEEICKKIDNGEPKLRLSKQYNINRSTIRYWYNNKEQILNTSKKRNINVYDIISNNKESYNYILGLYLGDGYINDMRRTKRLRITLDKKYKNIILECINNLKKLFENNEINIIDHKLKGNCVDVSVYSCNLNLFFPQNGIGKKHNRKIELDSFQLININYKSLLSLLFHSDGCFYKSSKYYYYNFSNKSKDIINIFAKCLDNIKIKYNIVYNKKIDIYHVNIYKQEEVLKLYPILGSKNWEYIKINIRKKKIITKQIYKEKEDKIIKYCKCGKKIQKNSKTCEECYHKLERKIERPPYEQLKNEIKELGYCATGRKYGVCDKSIRKWIIYYEKYENNGSVAQLVEATLSKSV